jgi:hypothetical protein
LIVKKYLKKKWLIGAGVLALILLVIGITVPAMAASGNSNNSYGNSYIDGPTMNRLATVLGMTPADLSNQLTSGKTLATLAQEHNVTTQALEDAIVAPYADQLGTQVKYGYLTQDQANNQLANAKNQAGSLLQQDMSKTTANSNTNDDNNFFEDCWNFMTGHGWGPGSGFGGGNYMGRGVMWGWGSNSNDPGTPPGPSATLNNYPATGSNIGGWGMGGMMGGW